MEMLDNIERRRKWNKNIFEEMIIGYRYFMSIGDESQSIGIFVQIIAK